MKPIMPKMLTRKYLLLSVTALLLYSLVGFILVPVSMGWYLPKYAQQNLHCQAGVDKIRINPFLLTLEMNRFSLQQADGAPLVAFERLFVDLEISSLFRWAVVLQALDLDKPDVHVVVEPDGSINFNKLATTPLPTPAPAEPDASLFPLILENVAVREGRIAVVDKRQSTPADFTMQGLELQLQDLATVKEHNGTYHLVASSEAGESIQWTGEIMLFPLRSKGKLSLNNIQLVNLWKFYRDSTNLEQPAGQINVATEYQLSADKAPVEMTLEGLRLSLNDLSLKLFKTDKPMLQLKKMEMEVPRFNLATKELHIGRLFLEEGAVDARIQESGAINLQQIMQASLTEKHAGKPAPASSGSSPRSNPGAEQKIAPPPSVAEPPFKVQVDAIEVKNIAVDLDDQSRKTPFKAAIAGVELELQANLEMGGQENKILFREISSNLNGISINSSRSREPLFATEQLTVAGGQCDLGAHSLTFARIAMSKGRLDAGRDAEGILNWQQLLQIKGESAPVKGAKPAAAVVPAWKFLVKSFELDGFSSKFSDLTTRAEYPVLSLQNIKAKLTEVDGTSPMGFTVGFQVEQGGTATVSGTVHPAIPSVEADVQVAGMVLTSLQPYIEPYVTLQLHSASIAAQGHLRYGVPGAAQKAAYEGSFSLNDLRLADAKTPKKPYLRWDALQLPQFKLTLQPDSLDVQEIKISKPVGAFIIEEDKTLNLVKVLKKQPVGPKPPPSSKPAPKKLGPQKEQAVFPYRIAKVRVDNGNMIFADLSLRPRFRTRIHDLKGTVTGLSSVQDSQAKVQLNGYVDQYGTAKINGVIRPNDFGRSSDIEMVFRNLEMKNLSPYSGRFAGRLIKSGKFSADLKYKLQDYKMTGDNKIVIDNLSLGEKVEHPESTNLPLDLAIALLKDASGRIDIGLPVSGDLNDPQFRIGPLIWKMFTNLIIKAAASPFRALGNLLGGESEHFDALEFDPGSAELLPPEKEKLLKIVTALNSRPQLKLVIQGRYSPEVDGLELKERSLRRMVATRLGTKLGPNDSPEPLDFTDSGAQNTLETMYKERLGKTALDELEKGIEEGTVTPRMPASRQEDKSKEAGMFATMAEGMKLYKIIPGGKSNEQAALWAGELYTRLVEQEKVADETFLQLAENRAQAIVAHLGRKARIPKDRVSVKATEPLAGDARPAVTLSLDAL